jgi:tetratricopeptide (TPR) repeat protein
MFMLMMLIMKSIPTLKGNEYFKKKKFKEAIECYSRSIALSPTAVAYANRAMAYLKIKRQVLNTLLYLIFTSGKHALSMINLFSFLCAYIM